MGVNLEVDGYTKTLNHPKILRNMQKNLARAVEKIEILSFDKKFSGVP